MSEEDHEIDVDSDVPEVGGETTAGENGQGGSLDKRAHHNELERRRRDHIKDSFHGLRDCIPSLRGEKVPVVSRAHILNKATEYIRQMQKRSSSREEEIDDLKEKNEILEEQVQALERAKSMGTVENVEELLIVVAERVKERQRQKLQFQKNNNSVQSNKTESGVVGKENGKTSEITSPIATALLSSTNKPNASAPNNGASENRTIKDNSSGLPNSINLLANNLKTAQTLLTALSKNLPPGSTLPANVKSLAAKVLASPIRPQSSVAAAPVPRGIVTATTVPRGTVSVHSQQPQPQTALTKQQISSNSAQSKPTVATHPSSISQSLATPTASVTIAPIGSTNSSLQPSSAPNVLSQKAARDLHAQLVALQHSAGTQQLSPELLAQVHSLLNLSSSLVHTADAGCEEGDGSVHIESDTSLSQATSLTTSPRSTSEPGMNVAVELAPVLSSPESGTSSNPGSKRPAVGGSTVSKRLKMSDS